MFFLFGGKAYSIFALLFGFTYYVQYSKQVKQGKDFSGRFAWRILLLLFFGLFNTLFYAGDILTVYALIGCILIPVRKLKSKWILTIAIILILQPIDCIRAIYSLIHTEAALSDPSYAEYYKLLYEKQLSPNFFSMIGGNITYGKIATLLWTWVHGRFFQTAGLFMLGYLLGREQRFLFKKENIKFWGLLLITSVISFIILFSVFSFMNGASTRFEEILRAIIKTWSNLAFTFFLISSFILLYYHGWQKGLKFFEPLGKMSLTNYIMQSLLGSLIYYQCGLALYQYTGASLSLLVGIILCLLQWAFCKWWLQSHKQGPLENIWHKLTWIKKQ